MVKKTQTIAVVVFKLDVDAVNAVHSTQIYLPPHGFVRKTSSNTDWRCCHAGCCVSINSFASGIIEVNM